MTTQPCQSDRQGAFGSLDGDRQPVRAAALPAREAEAREANTQQGPSTGLRRRARHRRADAVQVVELLPADDARERHAVAGVAVRPDGEQRMQTPLGRRRADVEQQAIRADRERLIEIEIIGTVIAAIADAPEARCQRWTR